MIVANDIKLDMRGANLLWPNKSYQAQASGGGLSPSQVGCFSGLYYSIEQQRHWKSSSVVSALNAVQECVHATSGGLCAQLCANVEDKVMGRQLLLQHQLTHVLLIS